MVLSSILRLAKGIASHNPFNVLDTSRHVLSNGLVLGGVLAIGAAIHNYYSIDNQIKRNEKLASSSIKSYDLHLKLEISRRAGKYLEKLVDAELAIGLELDDTEPLSGLRVPYKYSRQARISMKYPGYSDDNRRVACDKIHRMMVEDGLSQSQILQHHSMAVTLTFVKDVHEMIGESFERVIKNTDRWDSRTCK